MTLSGQIDQECGTKQLHFEPHVSKGERLTAV